MKDLPSLGALAAAIPPRCFEISERRSWYYLLRDLLLLVALYGVPLAVFPAFFHLAAPDAVTLAIRAVWWTAIAFVYAALFVVAHDGMHETFSRYRWANHLAGTVAFLPTLIPYYGTKKLHFLHHLHVNDVERDTQYRPLTRGEYRAHWPIWTLYGSDWQSGKVWNPFDRRLFRRGERAHAALSDAVVVLFVLGWYLACGSVWRVVDLFVVPWAIATFMLNMVTYLHHHRADAVYFPSREWTLARGALTTIDRSLGPFLDNITHHGTYHLAEHLFFGKMPHYRFKEATDAIRPLLGGHYRWDDTPLLTAFVRALRTCRWVEPRESDTGVRYVWARARDGDA